MRKEEFLSEYNQGADTDEIFRQLEQAGYQYLGGGQEATVWGRDEGEVLKVLMPSHIKETAEKSFMIFHDACQAMGSNPHVPRFIDQASVFEINGVDYMQISMERLEPIGEGTDSQLIVWALSDLCTNTTWDNVAVQLEDPEFWSSIPDITLERIESLLYHIDLGDCRELFNTMQAFYRIAQQYDLGWDLHTENVMQRTNGTLVITDPFYN